MKELITKIKTIKLFKKPKRIITLMISVGLIAILSYLVIDSQQVTAQIIPVTVSINHLSFGTVFPGEELQGNFIVTYIEDEGSGIAYKLIQKRKPLPPEHPEYPLGGDPEMPGYYRDLCPFLTKVTNEGEPDNENSAFVGPTSTDPSDNWIIYFKVPAIFGHVGQEHTGGVVTENGEYGCDISIDIDIEDLCNPAENLVINGGFETPIVTNTQKWDIYDSGTASLGWIVEWYDGSTSYGGWTRPEPAHLELHKSALGSPKEGLQSAELDTDWDGPTLNSLQNEPASVKIYQDISTLPGQTYNIKFYFSPRPNHNDNIIEFSWNGEVKDTITGTGGSTTNWTEYNYNFIATSTTTRLQFIEKGTPNSLGSFLDDASVRCVLP